MADTPINPNTAFMSGTDPAAIQALYAPVQNPQTPTTTATTPTEASTQPQTPSTPPTTTSAPTQPLSYDGSVVDLLNQSGQDSSFKARTALAQQYGIKGYSGSAAQNQQLAQKYITAHATLKNTDAPNNANAANSQISDQTTQYPTQQQQEPQAAYFDSISNMNPVVKQLYDQINSIVSPQSTTKLFAQLYSDKNIPAGIGGESLSEEQLKAMNIQTVMNGTADDIRQEISAAGGTATESQVQAMTATRNNTLLKQASYLQNSMQLKQDYVSQVVQQTGADQAEVDKQVSEKTGLLQSVATLQDTINKNATAGFNQIVNNLGYTGLSQMFQGNPQGAANAENLLQLNPGSLTNPQWLQNADTLKQQAAANAAARTNIVINQAAASSGSGSAAASPAVLAQVQYYKTTGTLPAFGSGAAGNASRANFWTAVANADPGTISDATGNKASLSAATTALRTQVNQQSATQTSLSTLDQQLSLLQQYSSSVDRTGSPLLNKYILAYKNGVQGDPGTAALQNIVNTASTEFAKILAGSSASISGVTVSSAQDAKNLINANMTPDQLTKVIGLMQSEGQFRLSAYKDTIASIKSDISGMGGNDSGVPTISKGTSTSSAFVNQVMQAQGVSYDSWVAANPPPVGEINVLSNADGSVGHIPESEFNSATYTRI